MAKERFVYRGSERTAESVTRKAKMSGGLYDSYLLGDIPMFKAKEGECCVRILPPTWEDIQKWGDGWEISIFLHYNVGPDNGAYLCSDKMETGEACPVCEARRGEQDEEVASKMKPSLRILCWVIDRDDEKAGPQVWSMPLSLFKDISGRSIDKRTSTPILIDHPEEGFDVVFNREGTDIKTKYTGVEIMRDASPIHDDEKLQDRWLDYIGERPLPELLNYYPAEHIEKVLFGKTERTRGDDAETPAERPSRRGSSEEEAPVETTRVSRRTSTVPAEEPPFDVDEPSAEEQPLRRGSSRRAEPEQEEAPAPVSRRRQLLDEGSTAEEQPRSRRPEPIEESTPVSTARERLRGLQRSTTRSARE